MLDLTDGLLDGCWATFLAVAPEYMTELNSFVTIFYTTAEPYPGLMADYILDFNNAQENMVELVEFALYQDTSDGCVTTHMFAVSQLCIDWIVLTLNSLHQKAGT